jgi:hypothetical protein
MNKENATKIFYFLSAAVLCRWFCTKCCSGQITVSGGILLQAVTYTLKKTVSSDVSEIITIRLPTEITSVHEAAHENAQRHRQLLVTVWTIG